MSLPFFLFIYVCLFVFFILFFKPFLVIAQNVLIRERSTVNAARRTFEVSVKDKAWTNSGFDEHRTFNESGACDRAICQPRVSNSPDSLYVN